MSPSVQSSNGWASGFQIPFLNIQNPDYSRFQILTEIGFYLFELFVKSKINYLVIEGIIKASAIGKLYNAITLTLVMNIGVGNLAS